MKKNITLSIMPTYECNNNCSYCYNDKSKRMYKWTENWVGLLSSMMSELSSQYNIERVEIYGGDLKLVNPEKLDYIITTYRQFCPNDYITCTDVHFAHELGFPNERINLSLNPERKDYNEVKETIGIARNCGVITVVTQGLLYKDAKVLLDVLGSRDFQGTLTLMPFNWQPWHSKHQPYVSNFDYCSYVIEAINELHKGDYKFRISNEILIKQALEGTYTPYMENNIFITPMCSWACVDFELLSGQEFFREFNTVRSWQARCEQERKDRLIRCGTCEYFNCCLAEHCKREEQLKPQEHKDICNGYIPLIEWGKEHYGLSN